VVTLAADERIASPAVLPSSPVAAAPAGPAAPAALTVEGVSRRFPNGTTALDGVSLTIASGEIVSVVGPSGCGKSTLLRIVARLDTATEGAVRLAEPNPGFVFQDATLLPWRTVTGNVELGTELQRLPAGERRRRASDAIALAGLTGFERHRPNQLSGGMRMRVSLARALTLRPTLFLLDEPFGALDELTRERLDDELLGLHASERFAALFVTHSIAEAVFLSHRVLVMSPRPGRLIAEVPVPFDHPRSPDDRFHPDFTAAAARVSAALRGAS
jgi:NitT/TauT family transport system ATP-binding protein